MLRHEFAKATNVRAITFDPDSGCVDVEFVKGDPRRYSKFTAEDFAAWCAAPSGGKWFHDNVRKGGAHPEIMLSAKSATEPTPDDVVDAPAPDLATAAAPREVPLTKEVIDEYAKAAIAASAPAPEDDPTAPPPSSAGPRYTLAKARASRGE